MQTFFTGVTLTDKNVVQFRKRNRRRYRIRKPFHWQSLPLRIIIPIVIIFGIWIAQMVTNRHDAEAALTCDSPSITDGDTLRCGGQRVRLVGIDAPEMPGSCRAGRRCVEGDPYSSAAYLTSITRTEVKCISEGTDYYDRTLARCEADGVDLSCAMIKSGHAERRYGYILCW